MSGKKNGNQETGNLEKILETPHQLINKSSTPKTQNPSAKNTLSPNKKQARGKGEARKLYQEKPLNMAEARREISMALKLHRMKQAREIKHSGPEHERFGAASHQFSAEQEAILLKYRRSPRTYASNYCVNNINAYPPGLYSSPYYYWPVYSFAPPLFVQENPNLVLPTQTLGLNLNHHQGSNLLDTSFINSSGNSSMVYNSSSSSPSNSCSPAISAAAQEINYMAGAPAAEIRPGGDDQHNTGGVDDLNIGVSAGRAEFLETTGVGPDETQDFSLSSPFDGRMEFPAWVNADESCVSDVCGGGGGGGDYFEDSALPCMEIEEIEGINGDWLA